MTPDRWQRVQQLFYEAESLPPAEQREFLEKACGGEESLFREVRTLLGYEGQQRYRGRRVPGCHGSP